MAQSKSGSGPAKIYKDVIIPQTDSSEFQIQKVERQRFIDFTKIDLDGLSSLFDSYATKKTYATGFFNLALIATNFTQLKQLIVLSQTSELDLQNTIVLFFICISLLFQLIVGVVLVFIARKSEFIDDVKRAQLMKSNNALTLLIVTISVINVFINVFLNV